MTARYGDGEPPCRTLAKDVLEDTFWHPGPMNTRDRPVDSVQERWDVAKDHCLDCPIFFQCRDTHWGEEYGVYGGADQYERAKYRRKLAQGVRAMDEAELLALYAQLWALHKGHRGLKARAIARRTGYAVELVNRALEHHAEIEFAEAKARELERASAAPAWTAPSIAFPKKAPEGADAWVWWVNRAWRGRYMAQTADGKWFRMKLKGGAPVAVIRWFLAEEVDIRRPVAVIHDSWQEKRRRNVA